MLGQAPLQEQKSNAFFSFVDIVNLLNY